MSKIRQRSLWPENIRPRSSNSNITAALLYNTSRYRKRGLSAAGPAGKGIFPCFLENPTWEENKGKNALFGGIDKLKFKKQVVPGDRLKLEVKIIKKKGPVGIGEAIATVDGKTAVKGELTFAIV